ncbi:endolysin [Erwinia phage PEp14]|uniref:Endolysin n=1 Tax=Erwinia phage PEp14 TaxID=1131315 RepID=H2DE58_9CAUD|nr:endolysin [Erwinia phage PEp14]AEY69617.1 endolysin [Erwinia phage PEp14]
MSQNLTEQDFIAAAARLNAPLSAVKAVASVESAGNGFLSGGRPKVQFEPHVMYSELTKLFGKARAELELSRHRDLVARSAGSYQSLEKENADMDRAAQEIDRTAALQSASWGAFQIMGYHWKTCGYATLQEFINAQYTAAGQLDSFVRFILADARLLNALRRKEWATFARIYNGPNYAKNRYDTKLADADKHFRGA